MIQGIPITPQNSLKFLVSSLLPLQPLATIVRFLSLLEKLYTFNVKCIFMFKVTNESILK